MVLLEQRAVFPRKDGPPAKAEPMAEPRAGKHTSDCMCGGAEKVPAAGAGRASGFTREDVVFLAQSAIDEMAIGSLGELARLDTEMHALVMETGAAVALRFPAPPDRGSAEEERPRERKEANGKAEGEEEMYRLILSDGFGMGGASPAIGSHRETIQKLQSRLKRKLKGPAQQRLFKRCWSRMEAEGAIAYNSNRTAASLDPSVRNPSDPVLTSALSWAFANHGKVGSGWQ